MAVRFSSRDADARPPSATNPERPLGWGAVGGSVLGLFIVGWQLLERRIRPEQSMTIHEDRIEISDGRRAPQVIARAEVRGVVGFDRSSSEHAAICLADGTSVQLPELIFPEPMGPFATPYVKRRFESVRHALLTDE